MINAIPDRSVGFEKLLNILGPAVVAQVADKKARHGLAIVPATITIGS
jgi:hypothetical protein